jgi:triosephosphate isomerase (TIM)
MSRMPLIAGNWKMNTTVKEAVDLIKKMAGRLNKIQGVEKVICPPFVSLVPAKAVLKGSSVKLGAQNVFYEEKGAYTGEISPPMLVDLCEYVIIGHSERRQIIGETDEIINKKLRAAITTGLKPILCIGETSKENEEGKTQDVLGRQIFTCSDKLYFLSGMVIAYEPIWAIGTGKSATGDDANKTIGFIREFISRLHTPDLADDVRILYGGSVNATNISEFMNQPEIDGALVGGASLQPEDFISIVKQASESKRS